MSSKPNAASAAPAPAPAVTVDPTLIDRILEQAQSRVEVPLSMETVAGFDALMRAAKTFADSTIVPKDYRGNVGNCAIAINAAARLKADPLLIMQNLAPIYGRPAWSSQFSIAAFNMHAARTGLYSPMRFRQTGTKGTDSYGCVALATYLPTGEIVEGTEVTVGLAKAEGWYGRLAKDGGPASKWPTMTDQMLRYRSATFMVRTVAPQVLMGYLTVDEVEDISGATPELTPVNALMPVRASEVAAEVAPAAAEPPQAPAPALPDAPATPAPETAPATNGLRRSRPEEIVFIREVRERSDDKGKLWGVYAKDDRFFSTRYGKLADDASIAAELEAPVLITYHPGNGGGFILDSLEPVKDESQSAPSTPPSAS